jgi:hypothetical protein
MIEIKPPAIKITCAAAGRKGGRKTAATHSHEHYVGLGKNILKKYGRDHFVKMRANVGKAKKAEK